MAGSGQHAFARTFRLNHRNRQFLETAAFCAEAGTWGGVSAAGARVLSRMKLSGLLFVLSAGVCARASQLDAGKEAAELSASGGCNLTQTLESWRSSIMEQVKDLLLRRHHTALPHYSRIPAMSDSLQNLNREFNETRRDIAKLTDVFGGFRELLRKVSSAVNVSRASGGADGQRRGRSRAVIRRIRKKKPVIAAGPVTRYRPRKKVRVPRLRLRPPAVQLSFSPRTCSFVPVPFLYSFIILALSS